MAELSVDHIMAQKSPTKEIMKEESDENSSIIDDDKLHLTMQDLSKFKVKRVLSNNSIQKRVAVVGTFEEFDGNALVVLEKKNFPDEKLLLQEGFFNETTLLNKKYRNDIYRGYDFFPTNEHNGLNATITFPATPRHIEKFLPPEYHLIEETPELYEKVTLPHILNSNQLSLQWVDNILDGTAEKDRVIFNDPDEETGFVLVKDLKWDDAVTTLHLIAITRKPMKSIRELNEDHLPLLKNIKEAGTEAISQKYGLQANQLRIFFHYQPSYYHLHVHFTAIAVQNVGINVERAHMISTVINNIELMSDYYQKAILTFCVPKSVHYKPYETYLTRMDEKDDSPSAKRSRRTL